MICECSGVNSANVQSSCIVLSNGAVLSRHIYGSLGHFRGVIASLSAWLRYYKLTLNWDRIFPGSFVSPPQTALYTLFEI